MSYIHVKISSQRLFLPDCSYLSSDPGRSWQSVNKNSTDLKELIPEFYHSSGDFMVNGAQLALGAEASGVYVADVALPPWAKDAADFVRQVRVVAGAWRCSRTGGGGGQCCEWVAAMGFWARVCCYHAADGIFF